MSDLLRICDAPPTASRGIDILTGHNKRFASVHVPKYVAHTAQEDARRIVDCVNALAGIPDPLAFVEAARGMNRLAQNFRDMLEAHCDNIGEGLCAEDQAVFDGWKAELTAFRAQLGEAVLARGEGV